MLLTWVFVLVTLTALATTATIVWTTLQSPRSFATGFIAHKLRERSLPTADPALLADLAEWAERTAKLAQLFEQKPLKQLILENVDMIAYLSDHWFRGNTMFTDGEGFRPIVELFEKHHYPRQR